MDITDHLRRFLQTQPPAGRYVVAYSGGLDSHVLLHALSRLGVTLAAVHVHHGLSRNADLWAEHCRTQCAALQVPCTVVRVQVRHGGSGVEAAARDARYAALVQALGAGEMLLTAHHQDDQAETLLLMLMRGAGIAGLAAMPAVRPFGPGLLGRPLLGLPRAVLHDYAVAHALSWVDDESNFDTGLDRNYLRHEVLPVLRRRWPALERTLARTAAHLAEAGELMAGLAAADLATAHGSRAGTLSVAALNSLAVARRRNLLRHWLRDLGLPLPDTAHLHRIEQEVLPARPDAGPRVDWPGAEVRRYRDDLYAMAPLASVPDTELSWDLAQPLPLPDGRCLVAAPAVGGGVSVKRLAAARVTVRFRAGGERCAPVGRGHGHELKKLFQEAGVPPWERERVPLLFVGDALAQVVGYWTCASHAAAPGEEALSCDVFAAADIASGGENNDNCRGRAPEHPFPPLPSKLIDD
ncbi:MAG: tRNA lysidine(34) synthetase TilS [Pseudomonadota bacterium]